MANASSAKLTTLAESATLAAPDNTSGGKGIWRARLIEADVVGSSGFYPAEVLWRDGPSAFPAGTHVYLDHPTKTEEYDRPERSVQEMAGALLDDAKFEEAPDGRGLYARIQFFEDTRDMVRARANHVGLSIRAAGEVQETPDGPVIRSITQGLSVDLVTRPGAGGRLVTMTESAAPESPPAQKTATSAPAGVTTTTSSDVSSLRNEMTSLKESVLDRLEQLSVDLARNTQALNESKRELDKTLRENQKLSEAVTFLRDHQEAADAKITEAKSVGDAIAELIEAGLPVTSLVRVARSYQPGQDLHESINSEREYVKKLRRETERGNLNESRVESSSLGMTESATNHYNGSSDNADLAEIRDLLSGGSY